MGGPITCDAAADHTERTPEARARARIVDMTQLCDYQLVKLRVVQCLKLSSLLCLCILHGCRRDRWSSSRRCISGAFVRSGKPISAECKTTDVSHN